MSQLKETIVIDVGKILTPFVVIQDARIIVQGKTIYVVGKREDIPAPKGSYRIDARNGILIPGLIDTHLCGLMGKDCREGVDAIQHIQKSLVRFGVTGFLPTIHADISVKDMFRSIHAVVTACIKKSKGAQILGIHLEGPYLNPNFAGLARVGHLFTPNLKDGKRIIKEAAGLLKLVTLSPELPGALSLINLLKSHHITIAASHSNATEAQFRRAVKAGLSYVTHLFCAMGDRSPAEPGVIKPGFSDTVLLEDSLTVSIIADGVHVQPALLKLALRVKGKDRLILVTDSFPGAGLPPCRLTYFDGAEVYTDGYVHRLVKDNTIAGSLLTLNKAVANMVRLAGVELKDAVKMASTNPAKLVGADRFKGRIAPGKDADLAIVNRTMHVTLTMVQGEIVYHDQ